VIELGFVNAHHLYASLSIAAYLWIALCVMSGAMPSPCLLVFLTLPLAVRAIVLSKQPDFGGDFTKAQAANVMLVLSGHFLLALAYYVAGH